jgi:LmbE family N-acetylglucosaminyl deacetylase
VERLYTVVSPHLDDAVLSCARLLAANRRSCITTVFAGGPSAISPLGSWDRSGRYFRDGVDVMGVRRGEDISGAAMVNATTVQLPYWERQYRNEKYAYQGLPENELPESIADELQREADAHQGRAWLIPLGLGHPDHRITTEAGLIFAEHCAEDVYVYEELPYAAEDETDVEARKVYISNRGFLLEQDPRLQFASDSSLKAAAINCHASQLRSLRRRTRKAIGAPERVWRLVKR